LFGGFGLDATGTPNGTVNDIWKLDFSTKQWTWVAGSDAANQQGVYGTQGTAAATKHRAPDGAPRLGRTATAITISTSLDLG